MTIQAIVYSIATGRVRWVHDSLIVQPNVIAYLAQIPRKAGEAVLVYNKQGPGQDTLPAWQAAVNAHTGKNPDVAQSDWYCGVDGSNVIQRYGPGDPVCDSWAPLTMVAAPWGADSRWIYDGVNFTAPVFTQKAAG